MRFKSIPSVVELQSLEVTGDVWFGTNITLKVTYLSFDLQHLGLHFNGGTSAILSNVTRIFNKNNKNIFKESITTSSVTSILSELIRSDLQLQDITVGL